MDDSDWKETILLQPFFRTNPANQIRQTFLMRCSSSEAQHLIDSASKTEEGTLYLALDVGLADIISYEYFLTLSNL